MSDARQSSNPYRPPHQVETSPPDDGSPRLRLIPTAFFLPLGAIVLLLGVAMTVALCLRYLQLWTSSEVQGELFTITYDFLSSLAVAFVFCTVGVLWVFGALACWHRKRLKSTVMLTAGAVLLFLAIWMT